MIALDTSTLSRFVRRKRRSALDDPVSAEVRRLVLERGPVVVPGIVVQEVLSGLSSRDVFQKIRKHLESFEVTLADASEHVLAAEIRNSCRAVGIAASSVDCLIAATSVARGASLYTTDADFVRMAPLCGLELHKPPASA